MKKAALIVSHEGADGEILGAVLDKNPRILFAHPNIVYSHVEDVERLTNFTHKTNNVSAVWLDLVLHNYYFANKSSLSFFQVHLFHQRGKANTQQNRDNKNKPPGCCSLLLL